MFFAVLRDIVAALLWLFNGNIHFAGREKIPKNENYILVAPHRSFFDPVFMAIGARPKRFIFMAKKELFVPVFGWMIHHCGAFPIDRNKPGYEALKIPIKELKSGDKSLVMFPTGTRHSNSLKGGAAVIAKMAKVRIVPVVYHGPTTFGQLILRKRIDVRYGDPIDVFDIKKMNNEGIAEVSKRIQNAFDQLDREINLSQSKFKYSILCNRQVVTLNACNQSKIKPILTKPVYSLVDVLMVFKKNAIILKFYCYLIK
jgi:1-acyl-sn-glycerol-3-phosphate acyltransferase